MRDGGWKRGSEGERDRGGKRGCPLPSRSRSIACCVTWQERTPPAARTFAAALPIPRRFCLSLLLSPPLLSITLHSLLPFICLMSFSVSRLLSPLSSVQQQTSTVEFQSKLHTWYTIQLRALFLSPFLSLSVPPSISLSPSVPSSPPPSCSSHPPSTLSLSVSLSLPLPPSLVVPSICSLSLSFSHPLCLSLPPSRTWYAM